MPLDRRYDRGVSSSRKCSMGIIPLRPNGSCLYHDSTGRFLFACPWSLTASYSTGPEIRNRWRAIAPEDPLRERPGAEPVRRTPLLLNNSSRSLAPVPPGPLLNSWCAVAQRLIPHSGASENPGILLALIKSRGRKNGGGDFK